MDCSWWVAPAKWLLNANSKWCIYAFIKQLLGKRVVGLPKDWADVDYMKAAVVEECSRQMTELRSKLKSKASLHYRTVLYAVWHIRRLQLCIYIHIIGRALHNKDWKSGHEVYVWSFGEGVRYLWRLRDVRRIVGKIRNMGMYFQS